MFNSTLEQLADTSPLAVILKSKSSTQIIQEVKHKNPVKAFYTSNFKVQMKLTLAGVKCEARKGT